VCDNERVEELVLHVARQLREIAIHHEVEIYPVSSVQVLHDLASGVRKAVFGIAENRL